MSIVRERSQFGTSPSSSSLISSKSSSSKASSPRHATISKPRVSNGQALRTNANDSASQPSQLNQRRVGVLPLVEGALDVGDDGRAVVWLDIGEHSSRLHR